MGKKKSKRPQPPNRPTTTWDVAIHAIDVLFEIIRGGHLYSFAICALILLMFLVAYKLPPSDLAGVTRQVLSLLAAERFYLVPMASALAITVVACHIQRKAYRREIKRLTEERSMLMHGLKEGWLKPLPDHNPSGYDIEAD